MTGKFWKKKESIESKEVDISGLLAQLHELHPDKKYVLWFKQALNPQSIQAIRRGLEEYQGLKVSVITGINPPEIYEFEDTANEPNKDQRSNDNVPAE